MISPEAFARAPAANTSEKRIVELDGMRGLAISLVLWHHLIGIYLPLGPASWLGWLRAGTCLSWTGVDLFFVLSGYFIVGILIDQRDSPRLTRTFYVRRATRILPLYYFTLAVYLVVAAYGFSGPTPAFPTWIYALFLTNLTIAWGNFWGSPLFSPLWSIAVEEQFYLVAPWVVRWMRPSRLPVLLTALVGLAWLFRAGLYFFNPENHGALHVLMPMRMDTFALGGLLAWATRMEATQGFTNRLSKSWPVWAALGVLVFFLLTVCAYLFIDAVNAYFGYTLIAVGYAFVLLLLVRVRLRLLVRLFSFGPLVLLGRYSYFIYLWHMLIGWGIVRCLGGENFVLSSPHSLAIVLLAIGSTALASVLSWKLLEQPMIKLGHRATY